MLEIKIFEKIEFGKIRMVQINGKPYFVANDIARALGYVEAAKAVRTHCKGVSEMDMPSNGGIQKMKIIPEGDVYRLIVKSQLPVAEKFESWVFDEVLPSIRQNGMYAEDELLDNPDLLLKVVTKLKAEREAKKLAEQKVFELETELDRNKDWYSIKRVAALNGVDWKKFDWRKLKRAGEMMGYDVNKIFDANYGEVNTYHRDVWEKVYPEYEL